MFNSGGGTREQTWPNHETERALTRSPTVSVILPAFNAASTVGVAITSVLRQSFEDFELLAVNDGSADGTADVLRRFNDSRVRVLDWAENRGLIGTLNEALSHARGEFVARQDADDVSMPDRLRRQVAAFAANPSLGVVGSNLRLRSDHGADAGTWSYPRTAAGARWQVLFKTPTPHSAVMYRRRLVIENGGYSEDYRFAEDFELWSRLALVTEFANLSQPLVCYTLSADGIGRRRQVEQESMHVRIAAGNMRRFLGSEPPSDLVRLLALDIDRAGVSCSPDLAHQAAALCVQLFAAFCARETGSEDSSEPRSDFTDRLVRIVRLLPVAKRLDAMCRLRRIAPAGAVGPMAWIRAFR